MYIPFELIISHLGNLSNRYSCMHTKKHMCNVLLVELLMIIDDCSNVQKSGTC